MSENVQHVEKGSRTEQNKIYYFTKKANNKTQYFLWLLSVSYDYTNDPFE